MSKFLQRDEISFADLPESIITTLQKEWTEIDNNNTETQEDLRNALHDFVAQKFVMDLSLDSTVSDLLTILKDAKQPHHFFPVLQVCKYIGELIPTFTYKTIDAYFEYLESMTVIRLLFVILFLLDLFRHAYSSHCTMELQKSLPFSSYLHTSAK